MGRLPYARASHVIGTGPSPYSLILLEDDMLLFERGFDPSREMAGRLLYAIGLERVLPADADRLRHARPGSAVRPGPM